MTAGTTIKGVGMIPGLIIDATPHLLSFSDINIIITLFNDYFVNLFNTFMLLFCVCGFANRPKFKLWC